MSGQGRPPQRDVFGAQCTARLCFCERFAGQVARSTASLESQGDWLGLTLYDSCIRDLSPAYAVAPCPRFFSRELPITWSTSCNPSAPGSSGRARGFSFRDKNRRKNASATRGSCSVRTKPWSCKCRASGKSLRKPFDPIPRFGLKKALLT